MRPAGKRRRGLRSDAGRRARDAQGGLRKAGGTQAAFVSNTDVRTFGVDVARGHDAGAQQTEDARQHGGTARKCKNCFLHINCNCVSTRIAAYCQTALEPRRSLAGRGGSG